MAGVWLAITQQQDFVSTVDNAGGNIDVLIGQLRQQAARAATEQDEALTRADGEEGRGAVNAHQEFTP